MANTNISAIRSSKIVLWIFLLSLIISYLYALLVGRYNGDFLGIKVNLSFFELTFNAIISSVPFIFNWILYKHYKRKTVKKKIAISLNFFGFIILILLFWNIFITLKYGVGIMAAPPYRAPASIKIFIQIFNRVNYFIGAFLYILISPKNSKMQFIVVILLLFNAYLRAGLGVILYLSMIYFIKYYNEIYLFVRYRYKLFIILILLFPILVSNLYDFRSSLRNNIVEEMPLNRFIFGRLIGRLSSFSDSAIILENPSYFKVNLAELPQFYFQKQAWGGIFGVKYMPKPRPEQILFWKYSPKRISTVAYMPGTQGAMLLSLLVSTSIFFINFLSVFIMVILTYKISRLLDFRYSNEFAFILLLYVMLSGVPNEFSFQLFSITVYVIMFSVFNIFKKIKIS